MFELDLRAGELRSNANRIRLQEQSLQILLLLLERPGQIVLREEIRQRLWHNDAVVEFDHSINTAVKKLRRALGDHPEEPRYVETIARRGYRLKVHVEWEKEEEAARSQLAPQMSGDLNSQKQHIDSSQSAAAVSIPTTASTRLTGDKRHWPMLALFMGLGLVLLTGLLGWFFTSPPPVPRVLRTREVTHFGRVEGAQLVTDGARIFFQEVASGGHWNLAEVSVAGGEPVTIATPFPNTALYGISPDHSELLVGGFTGLEDDVPLWILPVSGGSPRRLGAVAGHGAAWAPDGRKIAFVRGSNLYLIDRDGTGLHEVATAAGSSRNPRWSPDRRVLRFTVRDGEHAASLWEVSTDGRNLHRLFPSWREFPSARDDGEYDGEWTPDGRYFVFRSMRAGLSSIWATREKGEFLRRSPRNPMLLTTSDLDVSGVTMARNGKSVFFVGSGKQNSELARYDASMKQFIPYLGGIPARGISFSRDGHWVAYTTWPDCILWRSKLDGSDRRQLTFPPLQAFYPRWSPDGKWVAIEGLTLPGPSHRVYLVQADGGDQEPLTPPTGKRYNDRPSWSPDGKSIVIEAGLVSGETGMAIYQVDLKTRQPVMLPGSEGLHVPEGSPDGRYVVAASGDSHRLMLFDVRSQRWSELTRGGVLLTSFWSRDSNYVYSQDNQGTGQPVFRVQVGNRRLERIATSKQILRTDVLGYSLIGLAPDGAPLAVIVHSVSDIYALDIELP